MATENNQNENHENEAPKKEEKKSALVRLDDWNKERKRKDQEWKENHPVLAKVRKGGFVVAGLVISFLLGEKFGSSKEDVVIDTPETPNTLPDHEPIYVNAHMEQEMMDAMSDVVNDHFEENDAMETEPQTFEE